MRVLLLCHSFNSLSQRLFAELRDGGHSVSVELDINDSVTREAVAAFAPDVIIAPFLKRAIPEDVWRNVLCLVVHPGVVGDRGPSALDWAIINNERRWGVTVLQANAVMDGGDVWATREFAMRDAAKASLYRHEVSAAAVSAVFEALGHIDEPGFEPKPLAQFGDEARGRARPAMPQARRRIDWQHDTTSTVLRKIRSAHGHPGLLDCIDGRKVYLYDARSEGELRGEPGAFLARCHNAVCRATVDGAVWIGHARDPADTHPFKRAAVDVLADQARGLPSVVAGERTGYRDIFYEERGQVGVLNFEFYNGAMSTAQCRRLRAAYRRACQRPTRIIVLAGGSEFWSNGMHLNQIEAAATPAEASFENINAIDDLARDIIETTSHLTVAALRGNAGAGGVFLARACDEVWGHRGVVLNPHYQDMGNLYGSEYWTYLLPKVCGAKRATTITRARLPMSIAEATELGLVDRCLDGDHLNFMSEVERRTARLAGQSGWAERLREKRRRREADEKQKPLQAYRDEELKRMRMNFFGFDPSYHIARYNFVYKTPKSRTPLTLAEHRRRVEPTASQRAAQ